MKCEVCKIERGYGMNVDVRVVLGELLPKCLVIRACECYVGLDKWVYLEAAFHEGLSMIDPKVSLYIQIDIVHSTLLQVGNSQHVDNNGTDLGTH